MELRINNKCNNNCLFCPEIITQSTISKETAEQVLSKGMTDDRTLIIKGGEPTIDKSFFYIIRTAKIIGYDKIILKTNGRMLRYSDLCKDLKDSGLTDIVCSLHGSNQDIHDFLTSCQGSFKDSCIGILNALKCGLNVSIRTAITKANQFDLPNIMKLICSLGVLNNCFYVMKMKLKEKSNARWLSAKYSVAEPFLKRAIDIAKQKKINCTVEDLPFCFLKGHEDLVKFSISEGKSKCDKCSNCRYVNLCDGPFDEYTHIFGWEEFLPYIDK